MAAAPPPPYPAEEKAPLYENDERSSSDFSLDLKDEKRHVYEYDDDKEEEDAPKQTVPSGGILLDRLKAEKQGSTIIDTSSGRVLYSVAAENHFSTFQGTQSTFKHGEDPATPPYAFIDNIKVTLAPRPGESSSDTVTNDKHFLYSNRRFLGTPKHFKVDGVEYTLKMKYWTTKMKFDLVPSDAPDSTPLARFQAGYWRDRGDIVVHPGAIAYSSTTTGNGKTAESEPPRHTLLYNGEPTRLLDLALVAEAQFKTNLCQSSNVNSAAAASSAGAAAAAASASSC